jgi:hypothetical protein
LPQCEAITKTTRQQCKRHVNFHGEHFCSHHGGRRVSNQQQQQPLLNNLTTNTNHHHGHATDPITVARFMIPSQTPFLQQAVETNNNNNNCLTLAHQCLEFLSNTHPRMVATGKCGCSEQLNRLCKSMQLVKWVQLLIKLEHGFVDPTSIRDPQAFVSLMQNPTPAEGTRLFGDLYTAVAIFGPSIDFLPALFRHMRALQSVTPTPSSLPLSPSMSNIAAWAQTNSTTTLNQENDTTKSIDAVADGDNNDDVGQHIVGELDTPDCF